REKATACKPKRCPRKTCFSCHVVVSQSLASPFSLQVAIRLPSGEKAKPPQSPMCARKDATVLPLGISSTDTKPAPRTQAIMLSLTDSCVSSGTNGLIASFGRTTEPRPRHELGSQHLKKNPFVWRANVAKVSPRPDKASTSQPSVLMLVMRLCV